VLRTRLSSTNLLASCCWLAANLKSPLHSVGLFIRSVNDYLCLDLHNVGPPPPHTHTSCSYMGYIRTRPVGDRGGAGGKHETSAGVGVWMGWVQKRPMQLRQALDVHEHLPRCQQVQYEPERGLWGEEGGTLC